MPGRSAITISFHIILALSARTMAQETDGEVRSATDVFQRRIIPILRSDKSSSCTECHFAGVELKYYIREDQAETFAGLRTAGLIDVANPDESKILQFISRHTDHPGPLIAKVREAEYRAFRDWIRAAVREPHLLKAKTGPDRIGTELSAELIRHMRKDRVLRSFVDNIWSEVGRCVNCHSPDRNQRQVKEHGEQLSWIAPGDPEATLANLVRGGNIDTQHPDKSMILLKALGMEDHGGGPKFAAGSRSDRNFRRFLVDYAKVVNGQYHRSDQIPDPVPEVVRQTDQQLRIVELPKGLDQKLLKADIYRWTDLGWSDTPWGTAENPINGEKNLWQSIVFLVAPRGSKRAEEIARTDTEPRLGSGRYLIKIYIDTKDITRQDRDYVLGPAEFFGEVEIHGPWRPGYQPPKVIRAPQTRQ